MVVGEFNSYTEPGLQTEWEPKRFAWAVLFAVRVILLKQLYSSCAELYCLRQFERIKYN